MGTKKQSRRGKSSLPFKINGETPVVPPPQTASEPAEKISAEFSDKTGVLTTVSLHIKTLNDALKASKVDLKTWEVDRFEVNSWEVTMGGRNTGTARAETYTNYQVKVWLRRLTPTVMEQSIENLIARLPAAIKTHVHRRKCGDKNYLLEISLFDAHFGLLAWNRETGNNYDLKEAERSYLTAVDDLIEKTRGCSPGKIIFPVGNDFFHVNNPEGVTPLAHNILDVDGRLAKVVETGERALISALNRCLSIAPVDVIWIPGNHDPETSFFICRILAAYYRNNRAMMVNVEPTSRKYVRFGCNLLGYTHGNEEKHADLPTIMATERRDDWGECANYEWHIGHFHRARETRYSAGDTFGGVRVITLPSISGTDYWHFKKGYVQGNRMAEARLYDHDNGHVATYSSFNQRKKP